MFGIGPMELVVIVVVALLIFGPQRLPEFARTLGKGLAEFRRASNDLRQTLALDELQNDLRKTIHQPGNPVPPRPAQAGDTLPPGTGGASGAAANATTPAAPSGSSAAAPAPAAGSSETPPWKNNPGELPLDRDHEHHDPTPDAAPNASPNAAPDQSPRPAAADSGLGNVPVTGADPSGTRRG